MKWIAALCMLVDHIGLIFYPMDIRWRIIGRLAMPIFAYGIARGAFYTRSLGGYMRKMFLFSLFSQLPFWGMLYEGQGGAFFTLNLNVGFTFFLALLAIRILRKDKPLTGKDGLGIVGSILLAELLNCDYGSYGVLMVIMCYLLFEQKEAILKMALGYMILTMLCYYNHITMCLLQEIGVIAFGIVGVTKHLSEKRWRIFFYLFYPLHMLGLVLLKWWLMK